MDANQIERLKALALAAPEYSIYQILDGISNDEYLSFIAEARPAAVLELIAEVERLRAAPLAGTAERDAERREAWLIANPRWSVRWRIHTKKQIEQWQMVDDGESWGQWGEYRKVIDAAIEAHTKAGKDNA